MIYLIGVSHDYQWIKKSLRPEYTTQRPEELRSFLTDIIATRSPTLIAEEFNENFRKLLNVIELIGESVSREFRIEHLMCEPDRRIKEWILGQEGVAYKHRNTIPDGASVKDWHLKAKYDLLRDNIRREKYWFKALAKRLPLHDNIVFICGANHLPSFKKRLERKRRGLKRLKAKIVLRVGGLEDNLPYWMA
jgi:hypothetical protein